MLRSTALFLLTFFCSVQAQLPDDARPSLLFSREDIPTLKDRIQRPPYDAWWATVLTRAQNGLPDGAPERTKARLAKTLAFVYLMTDRETWAQQALSIMRDTRFPPRGGNMGQPHNEGEIVAHYALAYDMLHAYAETNDPSSLQEIRSILVEEAQRIKAGIVIAEIDLGVTKVAVRLDETPHWDNWHIRAYGGLGIAALALRDHPDAHAWSARAIELVARSLALQVDPQSGAYAEGPFYSRYSADVYLPYFIALRRVTGRDLFGETAVHALHEWSLNLRMPNGRRPNVDDGHLDDFYGHYLASIAENGGEFRWDWENNSSGLYVRQFSEPDAIALYDDSVEPTKPSRQPTVFMPSGGDAVFRSDWTESATYLLLRGEHGRPRSSGLSHEHPDETSFLLYAAGEMLALDAGYINFENHGKVNRGANHNLVLVDGQGPPLFTAQGQAIGGGNDAFIRDSFVSDNGDYAEVHAAYSGVDFIRRMLFVDRQYFLLADALSSDKERAYEWRLHGNGGGTSGGTYVRDQNLARWVRDRGELMAFLPARLDRTFDEVDTLHSFDAGQELTHTALRVQQRGADDHYLAVLYPRANTNPLPMAATLAVDGGEGLSLRLADRLDIAWAKNRAAPVATIGDYSSDGAFGWIGHFSADGRPLDASERRFVVHDATRLTHADAILFQASVAVDVSLQTSSEWIAGYVQGPDTTYTVLFPIDPNHTPSNVHFTGDLLNTHQDGDALYLELSGQGTLSVKLSLRETATYVEQQASVRFALDSPYPNPFNSEVAIHFTLHESQSVELSLHNIAGQKVRTMTSGAMSVGSHRLIWDGRDDRGRNVSTGIYFIRLRGHQRSYVQKITLLR